jgi:integrase
VFGHVLANPDRAVKRLRKASRVDFSFHDLRATCATGCSAAGAPPHVAAIVLGHARPPGVPDVTSKYDRADRTPEVRSALVAWAARVGRLVTGVEQPARVVAWRRGKR